jgi:acyl-CoA reductase-like NAD-dependent aldehyde dehydrogenase
MLDTPLIQHPEHFFIGGNWVIPSGTDRFDVISPATEEIFVQVAEAGHEDIDRAVHAARKAFDHGIWPRMTHADRAAYLRAMGDEVSARIDTLANIWTNEIGVAQSWATMLSAPTADTYRYYASLAETFAFETEHKSSAGASFALLVREPVGVVGAIVPWNGALGLIAYKIAPALLAGCTVVLKSSPESPGAALVMAEIAEKIGLPPGVLNVVTADREVSEWLVRHPGVDKITFTGSSAAGKRIGSICGERIARCTLELGGKSAAVVLDDADIAATAEALSISARLMTGQVCAALTRVVVSRHRHDALVDAMSASFGKIKTGDPFDPATEMGPLAMSRQRDRVEAYIAKGVAEGATLALGGGRPRHLNRGFFIEPTVFANVENSMTIAREEIFGPVVSVIPADNEQQAIDIANDSNFGLNGAVFTQDCGRAYQVARQLRSGTVGHNAFRIDFSIAFGGFKQSGIGREGGTEGLMAFLETKTILLDGSPPQWRT